MNLISRKFSRGLFKVVQSPPTAAYKYAMSSLSSQALVLTSGYQNDQIDSSKLHGMTLSSVTSLTINPEPIIQFNLQVPSSTSTELHKSEYLALHIMKPIDPSVAIARTFSMGTKYINNGQTGVQKVTTPFEYLRKDQWGYYDDLKLDDDPIKEELQSKGIHLPILTAESERVLICEKYKVFNVFNHEIWTCKVKDILVHIEEDERSGGLIYFNRGFHKIGSKLDEP